MEPLQLTQYGYDSALTILEAVWREPLGSISEPSLGNRGCAAMAEFRRAWVMREKLRFRLLMPASTRSSACIVVARHRALYAGWERFGGSGH